MRDARIYNSDTIRDCVSDVSFHVRRLKDVWNILRTELQNADDQLSDEDFDEFLERCGLVPWVADLILADALN